MAFAATMYREARGSERHAVELDGTLRDPEWRPIDVVVRDVSLDGFLAVTAAALEVGTRVSIGLHALGSRAAIVVWTRPDGCGCQFEQRLTGAEMSRAMAPRSDEAIRYIDGPQDKIRFEPRLPADAGLPSWLKTAMIVGMAIASWAPLIGLRVLLA